ncbi:MAG: amidohydrolase [Gemmatimonadetes bacterium]|nr:amidohydrolase [Gemmatimonadota bacterium]
MLRFAVFATLAVAAGCAPRDTADLVLKNATVYTGEDGRPRAEAVAVKGDRIVFVGSSADAARFEGAATRVEDLAGAVVFPGFADAHYHLSGVGEREMTLNLEGTSTKEAFLAKVKERVDQTPAGAWVVGRGWIETFWTPPVFPTRQDLDAIAPDHPVMLTRADGHASIVNTRALEIAGVTKATPAPDGGALNKTPAGELTGMLIDRAQGLVGRHLPAETPEQLDSMIVIGARRSAELGWTQVHDAGGSWAEIGRMRRLYQAGQVKLRIYKAVGGPSPDADSLLAMGRSIGEFGGRLTIRAIKTWIDGALGSRGAFLLAPYADEPGSRGLITVDTTRFRAMLVKALERGIQVETHAIGDGGNRLVLDMYQWAFEAVPRGEKRADPKDPRWRIEHAQIVDPGDIPRFKSLGVVPSMQPSHAIGDLYFAPSRLGGGRLVGAYAWKAFLDLGLPLAGGSDAPVERGEPMIEFYAAVARRDIRGNAGPDSLWHPEQKLSREQALKLFTGYPAYAAFEDDRRGTIAVGKWADFTILDRDIMTVPEADILGAKTLLTVIGGEIVHRAQR